LVDRKLAFIILACAGILSAGGFFLTKLKVTGVSKAVLNAESVVLEVWVDKIKSHRPATELFVEGEYLNLLVRNRPHGKLKIISDECSLLPLSSFYREASEDIDITKIQEEKLLWQCLIKLQDDQVLKTKDGYISHGNKLKISNMVALEGSLYYVKGHIVDIYEAEDIEKR